MSSRLSELVRYFQVHRPYLCQDRASTTVKPVMQYQEIRENGIGEFIIRN